jgi:hypothetical protein
MVLAHKMRHRQAAVAPSISFDYEAFFARTQATLIEFIDAELRVGPRFAESASLARSAGDLDHYFHAKRNAIKAAEFIQRFLDRISDQTVACDYSARSASKGETKLVLSAGISDATNTDSPSTRMDVSTTPGS